MEGGRNVFFGDSQQRSRFTEGVCLNTAQKRPNRVYGSHFAQKRKEWAISPGSGILVNEKRLLCEEKKGGLFGMRQATWGKEYKKKREKARKKRIIDRGTWSKVQCKRQGQIKKRAGSSRASSKKSVRKREGTAPCSENYKGGYRGERGQRGSGD